MDVRIPPPCRIFVLTPTRPGLIDAHPPAPHLLACYHSLDFLSPPRFDCAQQTMPYSFWLTNPSGSPLLLGRYADLGRRLPTLFFF